VISSFSGANICFSQLATSCPPHHLHHSQLHGQLQLFAPFYAWLPLDLSDLVLHFLCAFSQLLLPEVFSFPPKIYSFWAKLATRFVFKSFEAKLKTNITICGKIILTRLATG